MGAFEKMEDELAGVFIAHRAQLRLAALKIVRTPERADDVVQDAFIKVAEMKSLLSVRQPLAYLFQLVRNLAIDQHRQTALEWRYFTAEEEGLQVPAPAATPEALVGNMQQLRLVAEALARLPERTCRAFELCRLGGHTQREVAAQLGVSATLVNFMIRDALTCCSAAAESA